MRTIVFLKHKLIGCMVATASCVLSLLLFAGVTLSQIGTFPGMPLTLDKTFWNPIVGAGALYQVQVEGDAASNGTMEVDVLSRERVNGQDAFWIQVTGKQTSKPEWVWKMLVANDFPHQVLRSTFQLAGHPVTPLATKEPTRYRDSEATEYLDRETVAVPAGTFVCEHYRSKKTPGDIWLSKRVVLWGIVKDEGQHNGNSVRVTLLRTLTHTKNVVLGLP